ncbi:hypothetical protein NFI96_033573, partial [Prochilodus magdalenae]
MALFILLSFCLILEVHPQMNPVCISSVYYLMVGLYVTDDPQPRLDVSSAEGGSVQLDCRTPYARVSQCYYYPEGAHTNVKLSPSCRLTLTGADLTSWTGDSYRPPEPVSVICFYSVRVSGLTRPSPHSLPAPVMILDQKPEISVHYDSQYDEFSAECVIPLSGSAGAGVGCNLYTGPRLYLKSESRRGRSGSWSCRFTASKTDLLNRLQSVRSRVVSCDYSLTSHPSTRSPQSLSYDITTTPAFSTLSITPTPPTT